MSVLISMLDPAERPDCLESSLAGGARNELDDPLFFENLTSQLSTRRGLSHTASCRFSPLLVAFFGPALRGIGVAPITPIKTQAGRLTIVVLHCTGQDLKYT